MAAVLIETLLGDLVIDVVDNALGKNFVKLVKARYFTRSLVFAIDHHAAHLGDPTGTGEGGGSIFALLDTKNSGSHSIEKSEKRFLRSSVESSSTEIKRGQVVASLIRNLPDTVGSQFSIALRDYVSGVPVPIIGEIAEDDGGVLDQFLSMPCDKDGRPLADIRITRALVVYDPFSDPKGYTDLLMERNVVLENGRAVSSPSPERPPEESVPPRLPYNPEDLREETAEEVTRIEDRERAVVLELLGDLPDADIEAPKEVLFVCKLNPVTTDEDLELIFSRFDEKVKVEIIRDHETKQSLQYAFVEFTNQQAANEAYFKMNNALVDDRRIKVDFSQSVAKLWDKYKQKSRMPQIKSFDQKPLQRRGAHGKGGTEEARQKNTHQSSAYHRQNHVRPPLDEPRRDSRSRPYDGQRHEHSYDEFGRRTRGQREDSYSSRGNDYDHRRRDHERPRHEESERRSHYEEERYNHKRSYGDDDSGEKSYRHREERYRRKRSHSDHDSDSYERRKRRKKKDERRDRKENKREKKDKKHRKRHRDHERRSRSRS